MIVVTFFHSSEYPKSMLFCIDYLSRNGRMLELTANDCLAEPPAESPY